MNLGGEHLTAEDEHERLYGRRREEVAPYCFGPGHLYEYDDDGWPVRVADCDTCKGLIRNHWWHRGAGWDAL